MSYEILDHRIILVELSDDTLLYLLPETKRLIDINKHIADSELTYSITYVAEPTQEQRASAELNERTEQLVFLPK